MSAPLNTPYTAQRSAVAGRNRAGNITWDMIDNSTAAYVEECNGGHTNKRLIHGVSHQQGTAVLVDAQVYARHLKRWTRERQWLRVDPSTTIGFYSF